MLNMPSKQAFELAYDSSAKMSFFSSLTTLALRLLNSFRFWNRQLKLSSTAIYFRKSINLSSFRS